MISDLSHFLAGIGVDASKPEGGEILCVILILLGSDMETVIHLSLDWSDRRDREYVEPWSHDNQRYYCPTVVTTQHRDQLNIIYCSKL